MYGVHAVHIYIYNFMFLISLFLSYWFTESEAARARAWILLINKGPGPGRAYFACANYLFFVVTGCMGASTLSIKQPVDFSKAGLMRTAKRLLLGTKYVNQLEVLSSAVNSDIFTF